MFMKTVKKVGVRLHILNKYSGAPPKNYYSKPKKFELIIILKNSKCQVNLSVYFIVKNTLGNMQVLPQGK